MITLYHIPQWYIDTVLAWWIGAASVVPLAALGAWLAYLYRCYFPPHTDQLTWLYVYFEPREGGKLRLVLSTQEHLPDAATCLTPHDFRLLRHYQKNTAAGTVIRLVRRHSQQLIGNLANVFWATTCGPGHLARSQGLATSAWMVMVAIMATPANGGVTSKHRVVAVPLKWLDNLPKLEQAEPSPGMSQEKLQEWLFFLADMALVRREEGDNDSSSARINEMVIRA